ncbi:unnamed protein product [Linum trigynum]|uniref:Uncharacterized protein n=1 Tax=Linum trigynum TaxID=586398 RepID=A0AAV2G6L1_9ROSI
MFTLNNSVTHEVDISCLFASFDMVNVEAHPMVAIGKTTQEWRLKLLSSKMAHGRARGKEKEELPKDGHLKGNKGMTCPRSVVKSTNCV